MGARKNANVGGVAVSETTAAVGTAGTYNSFQLFSDLAGTVAIGNPNTMPSQILDAAGMLNIADGAIFVALGVQGSDSTAGQLKNTELIAMLDARYPTGASTVTVRFGTGISGTSLVNPTSPHTLDAWDAAIAWV